MRSWNRDADAILHIAEHHLQNVTWPSVRPCCNIQLEDEQALYYHLSDVHFLTSMTYTKRTAENGNNGDSRKKQRADEEEKELSTDDDFPLIADLPWSSTVPKNVGKTAGIMLPVFTEDDDIVKVQTHVPEFWADKGPTFNASSECPSLDDPFGLSDEKSERFNCPEVITSFAIPSTSPSLADENDEVIITGCRTLAAPSLADTCEETPVLAPKSPD
jgi:hypothetical protein